MAPLILIDRIRVPVNITIVTIWLYLVSFARYSDLLVENREIIIPHQPPVFNAQEGDDPVGIPRRRLIIVKYS